jgi:hypothetical protein
MAFTHGYHMPVMEGGGSTLPKKVWSCRDCGPHEGVVPSHWLSLTITIIIIKTIITRFQSEDQVCISTTLRDLDKSHLHVWVP